EDLQPEAGLLLAGGHARDLPAAEEEGGGDAAEHEDVGPLGEEEEEVSHAGVLGGVAGDELALCLGEIEGGAVALGERGGEEEEEEAEGHRVPEDEPVPGPAAGDEAGVAHHPGAALRE